MISNIGGRITSWPHSGETIDGYIWAVPDRFHNGLPIDISNGYIENRKLKSGKWTMDVVVGQDTQPFVVELEPGYVDLASLLPIPQPGNNDTPPEKPIHPPFPAGPPGMQGEKGDKGDKGDTGAIGPKGDTGPIGPKGSKGDKGGTGAVGPKGDTGAVGPKGDKGDTGAVGPKGDKGDTGAIGPKGDKGDTGAIGPKGDTGPIGPKGDTGPIGPKGNTGAIGPKGDTGPVGPMPTGGEWTNIRNSGFGGSLVVKLFGDVVTVQGLLLAESNKNGTAINNTQVSVTLPVGVRAPNVTGYMDVGRFNHNNGHGDVTYAPNNTLVLNSLAGNWVTGQVCNFNVSWMV